MSTCWCFACHEGLRVGGLWFPTRMCLCPECGNKRCPRASHHDNDCTGSNEPGQSGSRYQ